MQRTYPIFPFTVLVPTNTNDCSVVLGDSRLTVSSRFFCLPTANLIFFHTSLSYGYPWHVLAFPGRFSCLLAARHAWHTNTHATLEKHTPHACAHSKHLIALPCLPVRVVAEEEPAVGCAKLGARRCWGHAEDAVQVGNGLPQSAPEVEDGGQRETGE